eukprot:2539840-Amphidinium_carterae.1
MVHLPAMLPQDRYKYTKRPYKAEDVVKLQGTMPLHFTGESVKWLHPWFEVDSYVSHTPLIDQSKT